MTLATSRTNGFLFADLRDYTRYVDSHGDAAAAALLDRYRELVRGAVGQFGGAEIKTEGDSFYVVFPSASSAVQCGLAILDAAAERSRSDSVPIRVGIGVHAGETVETAEGYVGSAVNVAARVCSQARAGELLVTDTVRALTRTFLPVRFVDRRQRRLKGIAETVVMYRVEPVAAPGQPMAKPATGTGESRSRVARTGRVAALLLGLFVGGAAAGYLLLAAQRPPTEPATTTTPAAAATFPSAAEADLLRQVPVEIRDSCRRTEQAPDRLGNAASLRCDLGLAEEADTVWYDQFDSGQNLGFAFSQIASREQLPFAECSATVARGQGPWEAGVTHAGSALCYQRDGASWIVWTYRADRIMARATRGGDQASDWLGLFEWWNQAKLFLR